MAFGKKDGKKKFEYIPPSDETTRKRAENKGGSRDSFVRDDLKMFTPAEKGNRLRFLPWTGEERPHHYGMDIYVHYGIGSDNAAYLCPFKMTGDPCPICDARKQAEEEGDEETAKSLRYTYRVLAYIIDRAKEAEGPKLWAMPFTVDANICSVSMDEDTKDVFHIEDPEAGYDAFVTREGKARNTKYSGEKIARQPSPISAKASQAEEWLDFVIANPIEDVLVFHDYDYILNVFTGGMTKAGKKDDKEDKEEKPKEEKKASGLKKGVGKKEKPEPEPEKEEVEQPEPEKEEVEQPEEEKEVEMTWDSIHAMDREDLVAILEKEEVPESDYKEMDDKEIADAICEMYDLKEPEKKKGMSLKDKIKNRGK